jgi:hypothetical protein
MAGPRYDALLRFNSAALEARFWASAPVRSALLRADRVGIAVVLANNGMLAHTLATMGADTALLMQLGFLAILLSAQLAALRCATPRHRKRSTTPPLLALPPEDRPFSRLGAADACLRPPLTRRRRSHRIASPRRCRSQADGRA